MKYHVRFNGESLSPPDLHSTKEQAHEFFLAQIRNLDAEEAKKLGTFNYTLESVREITLGDMLPKGALTSIVRERSAELIKDDSFADAPQYHQFEGELESMVRTAMNEWSSMRNLGPEGFIVDSAVIVSQNPLS